jgi:hypothetical protein
MVGSVKGDHKERGLYGYGSGYGPVVDCFEYGNEFSISIKIS